MKIKKISINKKLLNTLCGGAALLLLVGCSSKDVEKKPETKVFGTGEHIIYVAQPHDRLRIKSYEGYDIVGVDRGYAVFKNIEPVLCEYSDYFRDYVDICTPTRLLDDDPTYHDDKMIVR